MPQVCAGESGRRLKETEDEEKESVWRSWSVGWDWDLCLTTYLRCIYPRVRSGKEMV